MKIPKTGEKQICLINRWISEKFDGIRVYWDGKKLWFRNSGIGVRAPDWFLEDLPNVRLEGELW